MISKQMQAQVESSSVIRAMFEEGKRLASLYGADNVFDFSLGNPSVEPPAEIKTALLEILQEKNTTGIHGYMNNSGFENVRDAIAQSLNRRFHTNFSQNNIIMTVGAAGGLNVIFKTLLDPQDEVIVFAPFFG
ncbi:MAG TPA: aminotransferase class I/II-fold pyridoxal phosphate-dependent enzyme, partial [Syntrophomonas sp.]|nr:aminotransferase class I/II-fold pyridoxal phosphate-dependent enzyme [Syntrophomonas sp.]